MTDPLVGWDIDGPVQASVDMEEVPVTDLSEASPPPITVRCACGWESTGVEDEVVAATIDHGRRLHNMEASRDEVLAMAVPSVDTPA